VGVEVAVRERGKLIDVCVLRSPGEEYVLGHLTPEGRRAPERAHAGLRLLRINPDRTVDLVFPREVGGHLMRGQATVAFSELTEGRKYSCLRLEPQDVLTVILGAGRDPLWYHVRFLRPGRDGGRRRAPDA
jgi:hypothetical protein